MKTIEEIEKMDPEQLESAALQEVTSVPSDLEGRIKGAIAAKAMLERQKSGGKLRWLPYAAMAAAAATAAVVAIPLSGRHSPKDTFDDPYLAYAQVEATFQKISDKMALGVGMAEEAGGTAGKPIEIIRKINGK
ncbi:MAG: hypothetical protein IJJ72_08785 [Bacteroidales bacterium]|nr:hypothetical protein [Bacteroidales bacterium]